MYQLDRITKTQAESFVSTCINKFMKSKIEPGNECADDYYFEAVFVLQLLC